MATEPAPHQDLPPGAAPAGTSTTTSRKVIAGLAALALVLGGATAIWWFSVRRANAVYLAAAATAEAPTVVITAHVEVDEETLRSAGSDAEGLTPQDVSDVGLRIQRLASDDPSGLPWLPSGPWSYSLTYRGTPAATVGVTEQTGAPVLAMLIDPTTIDAALARFPGSSETSFDELAATALDSADDEVLPYLRDLLDGKSVGVDLGPDSYVARTVEEGLAASTGADPDQPQQELLQDLWSRLRDRLPEAVTTEEVGEDEFGTHYTVAIDVPKSARLVADALGQQCAEQPDLDAAERESCQDAADQLSQWDGDGAPAQLQFQVWVRDDRLSRVAFDVAQAIRGTGQADDLPPDAAIQVIVDLAYDQSSFDFVDLVVIPDDALQRYLGESPSMASSRAGSGFQSAGIPNSTGDGR